jgi:hypothetical protein
VLIKMQINGNNFKVYLSDTVETIKNRIAVSLNTLPEYLIFDPEIQSATQSGNITVVNALTPVLQAHSLKFPEENIDFNVVKREDAERFFIATHTITKKTNEEIKTILRFITGLRLLTAESIWQSRASILKKMREKLDKLKSEVNSTVEAFEEFENIVAIPTVEYEVSHVQFNIKFSEIQGSLAELFNSLVVNKAAPYANMGSFYKVFHDFTPNQDWLEMETPNVILLKVNSETNADLRQLKNQYKKYTNAAFTIVNNQLIATMDMSVGYRNISREVFIDRALEVFPNINRNMITSIKEQATVGFITYPYQTLLIPVWAELTMNNTFFNKIIALNESIRASKIKMNAYVHILNTNDTLSISMKETDRANLYGMEDEGSYYVRVRVKAKTITDSLKYQKIVGRLFTLYNNNLVNVLTEYRQYIPNFLKDEEARLIIRPRKLEKLELRAIAPEIFLPTYSRKCLKRPTIISKEQADLYDQTKEKAVMAFPIYGESTKRYYICEHDSHPFPGLRDNTLENKKMFPYIPCCYTKDQNRLGSKYRNYFSREEIKTKHSAVQDIFVSGKALPPGLPGTLPANIKNLFSLIEPNPTYQFIRVGTNNNKNSFLECVMLALNIDRLQNIPPPDRIPVVERKRREIATAVNAMAAKQEFYDEPLSNILDKLTNSTLNALEFVHVLEVVFNCSIFVFTSSDKDPGGSLVIPRHAQAYYKTRPILNTIFIYQHDIGVANSNTTELQCELITRTKTEDIKILENMTTAFLARNNQLIKNMWGVFRSLNRSFSHNTMLPSIAIPVLKVESQIIDIYGKCRVLNFNFNGTIISMISEPLPPYAAKIATTVNRVSLETLKTFASKSGVVQFIKQRLKNGQVREVEATMSNGNLNVTFLCDDGDRLDGVPIVEGELHGDILKPSETIISQFSHNKKIAKIIYQYGLFFLSKFMDENNYYTPLNDQQLRDFINLHLTIIPNYNYISRNLSSKFSIDSQFVENRSKVITTSREMLIKLIYMLRLYQNTHFDQLVAYKSKVYVDGFYDEISDFDESPSQFVLDTPEAVEGLIESYKTNNSVTKNIRINQPQPYFIYNPTIRDQIYLAQNTWSIHENNVVIKSGLRIAMALVRFWDRYGYNPGIEVDYDGEEPVDIYSYINTEEIINLTNENGAIPGLVLGYLVNGQPMYTALMQL